MIGKRLSAARSLPADAWVCALVACLNAVCWSFLTPPFQVPDEPDHFAYVQQLAEHGSLPQQVAAMHSKEEESVLKDLHFGIVRNRPGSGKTIASEREQRHLETALAGFRAHPQRGDVKAGLANTEPPLYYAYEAIAYKLGAGGTLLDRLALMRLSSALFAALTAFFAFLFLREALPAVPWAWTVGGLCVALFPLLGFMSGAVTSEALLYAVSAILFYALARALRRGFGPRSGTLIGLVLGAGILSKLNFVGLIPGAIVGLCLLTLRLARDSVAVALRSLLLAILNAAVPVLVFIITCEFTGEPAFGGIFSDAARRATHPGSLFTELGYIWQLYLPHLPWMRNDFVGLFTPRAVWFDGWVGLYGWLDTPFPGWVYELALLPAAVVIVLFAKALLARRRMLRERLAEVSVYLLMSVGLLGLVGADGYQEFPREVGVYAQARYLLPLVVLWGALLALAARGGGRRWGPVVGTVLVALALAHDIFSQLLVVARYYG